MATPFPSRPGRAAAAMAVAALALALGSGAPALADTASTSSVPTAVEVTTPYPRIAQQPGADVKFDLSVLAPTTQQVGLTVEGVPDKWSATLRGGGFVIDGVTASPDKAGTATLEVKIADDAPAGTSTITVKGTGQSGTSSLPITIRVEQSVDSAVTLKSDFLTIKGKPTDTFSYNLTIENNTPEQQVFNFAPQAPDGWDVTVAPSAEARASTVSIDAGQSSQVRVDAKPPASVAAGTYPISVTVLNARGQSAKTDFQAVVSGGESVSLSTPDQRLNLSSRAGGTSRFAMVVENNGSAPLTDVSLSATPPTNWTVTFEPAKLDPIDPGSKATVTAVIKPSKDAIAGDYTLNVTANAGTATSSQELRVTIKTSRWWGIVGVVVIVVAIAALLAVFRRFGRR